MNKAIANILKTSLTGTPLIEKIAGLIQVAEYEDTTYDESGTVPLTVIKKIPVSADLTVTNCEDTTLVPDSSKTGILYFEDNGTIALGREGIYFKYRSKLRLVAWVNTTTISNAGAKINAQALLINELVKRIDGLNFTNQGLFIKLQIGIDGIPKQDKGLFSAYTYDLYNTQFIMPPFEYFAIDISVTFLMHPDCIETLTTDETLANCQ